MATLDEVVGSLAPPTAIPSGRRLPGQNYAPNQDLSSIFTPSLSAVSDFGNNIDQTPVLGEFKSLVTTPFSQIGQNLSGQVPYGAPLESYPRGKNEPNPTSVANEAYGMTIGAPELGLAQHSIDALTGQVVNRGLAAAGRVGESFGPAVREAATSEVGTSPKLNEAIFGKSQMTPIKLPGGRWSIQDAAGNIDPNLSLKDEPSAMNLIAKRTGSMSDTAKAAFGDFANPETAAKMEADRLAKQAAASEAARTQALAARTDAAAAQVNDITTKLGKSADEVIPLTQTTAEEEAASAKWLAENPVAGSPKSIPTEPTTADITVATSAPKAELVAQNVDQAHLIEQMRGAGASDEEIASALGIKIKKTATPPADGGKPPTTGGTAAGATPPSGGGALGAVEQATGVFKSAATAFAPFHGMFRHNLPFLIKDNAAWREGWVAGAKAWKNPEMVADRIAEMKSYLESIPGAKKLFVGTPHGGAVAGAEDIPSSFLEKLPVYGGLAKRSGAGFTMANNEVKFSALKNAIDSATAQGATLTEKQVGDLAESINRLGGRGFATDTDGAKGIARALNVPFFSPQLKVSRVRMYTDALAALPQFFASKGADPVASYKVYGALSHAAGVGALLGLAKVAGFNVNINPSSPGFLTADLGPVGGVGGGALAALGSQIGWTMKVENGRINADVSTGEAPIIKAFVQSVFGKPNIDGTMTPPKDRFAPWGTLGMNSLSPGISDAIRALQGKQTDLSSLFMGMSIADALKGSGVTPTPTYRDGLGRIDDGALPSTPVTQAWDNAMQANPGMGNLTAPGPKIASGKTEVVLNPQESDRLAVLTGDARNTMISQAIAQPTFQNATPEIQRKKLEAARNEADRQAKVTFGLEQTAQAKDDTARTIGASIGEKAAEAGGSGTRMDYLVQLNKQGSLTAIVKASLDNLRTYQDALKPNYQTSVDENLRGSGMVANYLQAPAFVTGTPQDWKEVAQQGTRLSAVYQTLQKEASQKSTANRKVTIDQLPDYAQYVKDWSSAKTTSGRPVAAFLQRDATVNPNMVSQQRKAIEQEPLFSRSFKAVATKRDPYSIKSPPAP